MPRKIVILGAGISGLTSAWNIRKQMGSEVLITILEKSHRVGGWIQTIHKDGFLFEQGPRSCRSKGTGTETLKLIEDLGLQDQVIVADSSARFRYLYTDHKLQKLPYNLTSFLFSPLMKGVIPALWNEWRTVPGTGDETIYDFISRRFSSHVAQQLIDPVVTGIYAGDIRQLSIRSCFPLLSNLEQKYGSVLKGLLFGKKIKTQLSPFIRNVQKSPIFSLKGGMESLTKELERQLKDSIRLNCYAEKFEYAEDGVTIKLNNGTTLQADHVISTLPREELHYATVAVVNFGYRGQVLKERGFGYLIPSNENESILGCVWDSSVFPTQNNLGTTVLSVMMGGIHHPEIVNQSEDECIRIALESLKRHLGIYVEPDVVAFKLAKHAIPQYSVGHIALTEDLRGELSSRLTWIGTAFGGVSVNDCVASGIGLANCIT